MDFDFDKAIQQALKKMTEQQALRRMTLLNILHINIDLLIQNATRWFGDDIPDEYRQVINSLMALTTSFLEGEVDYESMIFDQSSEVVDVAMVLNSISNEMNTLFGFGDSRISIDAEDNFQLVAPRKNLTREIYHIILAVTPFMEEESRCRIKVSENYSNVVISLEFNDLSLQFPGIPSLKKAFFTYQTGESSRVGMGMNSAITALKEMGAQVSLKYLQGGNNIAVDVSFPSMDFMTTLDEIRRENTGDRESVSQGDVVMIIVSDRIIEMLLQELLTNDGYHAVRTSVEKYKETVMPDRWKGIVIDFDFIRQGYGDIVDFLDSCSAVEKIIILYEDAGEALVPEFDNEKVIFLKKPIEVDKIVKYFEE